MLMRQLPCIFLPSGYPLLFKQPVSQVTFLFQVECIIAILIYKNLVKGYFAHKSKVVVLSKQDPFPKLNGKPVSAQVLIRHVIEMLQSQDLLSYAICNFHARHCLCCIMELLSTKYMQHFRCMKHPIEDDFCKMFLRCVHQLW